MTAVDVGFRRKGGILQEDSDVCLLVWVKEKLPKSKVDNLLPKEIDGVSVDVLEGEVLYTVCRYHSLYKHVFYILRHFQIQATHFLQEFLRSATKQLGKIVDFGIKFRVKGSPHAQG